MSKNKTAPAGIYDINLILQAGIDPKTGLPIKLANCDSWRKNAIKTALRIVDEQDAVNRYVWYNVPGNISSQELERMLYYKGQLCFFYNEALDEFFFMPYALDGTIDFYGRFNSIHPIPFVNGTTESEKALAEAQSAYLSTLKLKVLYDIPTEPVDVFTSTVLLHDYTKQLPQSIISRQIINDPILDIEADCIPLMRTNLMNSSGVVGMRVNSQDEATNVMAANKGVDNAALNGQRYIPILANLDFQELAGQSVAKSEEYLQAMQSLDNFRLSLYGLKNGGLFTKKAHLLEQEQAMNNSNAEAPLVDGLKIRQRFCDIVNSVWGIGIWCDISESAMGIDKNGDMQATDSIDQSGSAPGDQPQMQSDEEEE